MTTPAEIPAPRAGLGEETFRRASSAPIFEELARTWQAAGRTVPGRPDAVWDALVGRAGRHRVRAAARPGGPPGPRPAP